MWVILHDLARYTGEAGILSVGHSQKKYLDLSVQVTFFVREKECYRCYVPPGWFSVTSDI